MHCYGNSPDTKEINQLIVKSRYCLKKSNKTSINLPRYLNCNRMVPLYLRHNNSGLFIYQAVDLVLVAYMMRCFATTDCKCVLQIVVGCCNLNRKFL